MRISVNDIFILTKSSNCNQRSIASTILSNYSNFKIKSYYIRKDGRRSLVIYLLYCEFL